MAAASERLDAPSLAKIVETIFLTVFSVMPNSLPMSALDRPAASEARIFR